MKGKTITAEEVQQRAARGRRSMSREDAQRFADKHNERYRIVAMDGETPIIREELNGRMLKRLSPKARRVAGSMLALSAEQRREVLACFGSDGSITYPWPVKE